MYLSTYMYKDMSCTCTATLRGCTVFTDCSSQHKIIVKIGSFKDFPLYANFILLLTDQPKGISGHIIINVVQLVGLLGYNSILRLYMCIVLFYAHTYICTFHPSKAPLFWLSRASLHRLGAPSRGDTSPPPPTFSPHSWRCSSTNLGREDTMNNTIKHTKACIIHVMRMCLVHVSCTCMHYTRCFLESPAYFQFCLVQCWKLWKGLDLNKTRDNTQSTRQGVHAAMHIHVHAYMYIHTHEHIHSA